jgi:hypothetical protein
MTITDKTVERCAIGVEIKTAASLKQNSVLLKKKLQAVKASGSENVLGKQGTLKQTKFPYLLKKTLKC